MKCRKRLVESLVVIKIIGVQSPLFIRAKKTEDGAKHISTCSVAPWHAVIEPRRMAAVGIVSPTFYVGRYISAWRIEIRTGFYRRAKKTRPIRGLK